MNNEVIMLFLDLEGTIIEEENENIDVERINILLDSINKLEEITNRKVNIHIVSPVSIKSMGRIMNDLDKIIVRYNINNARRLEEVHSAVAYPEKEYIQKDDLYDKIFPMQMHEDDFGKSGKAKYVRLWIESAEEKENSNKPIFFSIYGGNGLNDVSAMNYIKRTKKGFVICPNNSHEEAKKLADYISEKDEAIGIADGIDYISKQIQKRKIRENKINNRHQEDDSNDEPGGR